jgi:hypothetical protein
MDLEKSNPKYDTLTGGNRRNIGRRMGMEVKLLFFRNSALHTVVNHG